MLLLTFWQGVIANLTSTCAGKNKSKGPSSDSSSCF